MPLHYGCHLIISTREVSHEEFLIQEQQQPTHQKHLVCSELLRARVHVILDSHVVQASTRRWQKLRVILIFHLQQLLFDLQLLQMHLEYRFLSLALRLFSTLSWCRRGLSLGLSSGRL